MATMIDEFDNSIDWVYSSERCIPLHFSKFLISTCCNKSRSLFIWKEDRIWLGILWDASFRTLPVSSHKVRGDLAVRWTVCHVNARRFLYEPSVGFSRPAKEGFGSSHTDPWL